MPNSQENSNSSFKAPTDYAIVVGIDHYQPEIQPLQGCVNDAKLFHAWLVSPDGGGLDPARAKLICSSAGSLKPVRDEIEDEFLRFYKHKIDTGQMVGRRLYLFFSGHGVTPPTDENDCGLVLANSASPGILRALPGNLALRRLQWAGLFEQIVLLMDCCREVTGDIDAHLGLPDKKDPTLKGATYLRGFAAQWHAQAAEREMDHPLDDRAPRLWHGVFTHALLKALKSGMDEHGEINSESLKKFIRRYVHDLLPADDNRRPEILFDDERPIVFGSRTPIEVSLQLSKPEESFEVLDGAGLHPVSAPVTKVGDLTYKIQLRPGRYLIQTPAGGGAGRFQIFDVLAEPKNVVL